MNSYQLHFISFQIDQTSLGLAREFLVKGFDEKLVKSYHNFMVDNAVIFGADKERAEKELKESLEFEMKLASVSSGKIFSFFFFKECPGNDESFILF